jgi:hypothetical protein
MHGSAIAADVALRQVRPVVRALLEGAVVFHDGASGLDGARLAAVLLLETHYFLVARAMRQGADRSSFIGEAAMFVVPEFSRNTQRVTCMLMAALIVTVILLLGAYGVESLLHPGYSVTITELH